MLAAEVAVGDRFVVRGGDQLIDDPVGVAVFARSTDVVHHLVVTAFVERLTDPAADVVERYRLATGSDDPALRNGLDEMRRRARLLEQQRLEQEIRDSGALEDD